MKLSLVIPAKSKSDPKLQELLASIDSQDFPKSEIEVLVICDGTSESAKAIGIRKAKGEVIGILASDNELIDKTHLSYSYEWAKHGYSYSTKYYYNPTDDILNRYFALIGGNDPLCFYMRKNDKSSYFSYYNNRLGSIGDNGFFIRKDLIEKTDLDNYYHIDNAIEAIKYSSGVVTDSPIWHKTGGNIFKFFAKRYRYGFQHAFNKNRRWHLVDFSKPQDIWRLTWFIFCSVTLVEPLCLSIRGYLKLRDVAWFLHPVVCLMTVLTYGCLMLHLFGSSVFRLLSAPMVARRA